MLMVGLKTRRISFTGNIFVLFSILLLSLKYPIPSLVFSLFANGMFIWYGIETKHYNFILFSLIFAIISIGGLFNYLLF